MASVTTWGDIRLATLQKMFSSDGTSIQLDSSNQEYLYSMPQAANEALQLLATAGKFLVGETTIINEPVEPIYAQKNNVQIVNDTLVLNTGAAKAYYFRAEGKGTVRFIADNEEITSVEVESPGNYTVYKGRIPNDDDADIKVVIEVPYRFNFKNFALYDVLFENDEAVDPYEDYIKIVMTDIDEDFYQLYPNEIYYEGHGEPRYILADQYYQEAGKILVLPRSMPGAYTVYYRKYPQKITLDTEDSYVLAVDPEVAALIPLYMAAELYKDDDNGIATTYRNEFEVGRESLSQAADIPRMEEFISVYGWS